MIHKNWAELIKPAQLEVKQANDPTRQGTCLLYTSDAADEKRGVDLGGRRIIKKKKKNKKKYK